MAETGTAQNYLKEEFEPAKEKAKADGLTVVESTPRTLLLDLDNGGSDR